MELNRSYAPISVSLAITILPTFISIYLFITLHRLLFWWQAWSGLASMGILISKANLQRMDEMILVLSSFFATQMYSVIKQPVEQTAGHCERLGVFLCREYYSATSWTLLILWLNRFRPWVLLLQHFHPFSFFHCVFFAPKHFTPVAFGTLITYTLYKTILWLGRGSCDYWGKFEKFNSRLTLRFHTEGVSAVQQNCSSIQKIK